MAIEEPLAFETEFDEKLKSGVIDRPPPGRLHLQPILKLPETLEDEIMKVTFKSFFANSYQILK